MKNSQRLLMGGTIVASVLAGGAFGAVMTGAASAATETPSPTATAEATPEATPGTTPEGTDGECDDAGGHRGGRGDRDPSQGGHVGRDGTTETLLTGDEAEQVTAAVEAEYPDATIERVETDAEGAAYEAHIVLADGARATVKLDESFTITGTESGR
jgi:hypothetical protein